MVAARAVKRAGMWVVSKGIWWAVQMADLKVAKWAAWTADTMADQWAVLMAEPMVVRSAALTVDSKVDCSVGVTVVRWVALMVVSWECTKEQWLARN